MKRKFGRSLKPFFLYGLIFIILFVSGAGLYKSSEQNSSNVPVIVKDSKKNKESPEHIKINTSSISSDHQPWKLTWSDEFNSLSDKNWTLLDDANGYGNRKQHYKPENITLDNGVLKLNILKEKSGEFNYTSGALISKDKVHFQFGKLEIRAKFPSGQGLIPAIWMWTAREKQFPEIDIAEIIGQQPNELWNVVHDEIDGEYRREYNMTATTDLSADFHVYGIEWSPKEIVYTLDGKVTFIGKNLIPKEEMYLYMNTGVGGNWVGDPDETTLFPSAMLIDYVRYYSKEDS